MMMAVSSESGMAVSEITAVLTWPKNEQHHRHQHATEIKRVRNVMQRNLNECRRTMQARIELDVLLIEERLHVMQHDLERLGHLHRIGVVLAGQGQHDPVPALDEGIAKFRLRSVSDVCDVF